VVTLCTVVDHIAMRLRAGRSGFRIQVGVRRFFFKSSLGPTESPSRHRGSFSGVKRPRREVNPSPPSSDDVKNEWSHTSAPPYV
jgi:hypothetical protein